jgi:hypothetical protein
VFASSLNSGSYTYDVLATISGSLYFEATSSFIGSIDNVSVKEVTGYNKPRLDYSDSSCPSLLLEPTRTNLITISEGINSMNAEFGSIKSLSNIVAPNGTTDSVMKISRGTNNFVLRHTACFVPSSTNVFTIYAKAGSINSMRIDASDQTFKTVTLTDEWQRIELTHDYYGGGNFIDIDLMNSSQGDYIYLWGAQCEQGSYPTSYIPTDGIIKTRLQDECTDAGDSSTFNSSEGVLFFEGSALADDNAVDKRLSISDGTNNNRVLINIGNGISNTYTYYYAVSGSNQINRNISVTDITVSHKLAVTWKVNEFKVYLDGILNYTDSSGSVNPAGTFTQIQFTDGAGGSKFFGKCKDLRVYNTALTDAELEEISSWESFTAMANSQKYTIK